MGDENTAEYRARAHPSARLFDAERNLLAPSFHNAFTDAPTSAELLSEGVTAAHVRVETVGELAPFLSDLDATAICAAPASHGPSIQLLESGATAQEMATFMDQTRPGQTEPALTLRTPADMREFETLTEHYHATRGRLYLDAGLEADVEMLMGWDVIVVLSGDINLSLAQLPKAGIPFAFGGRINPWDAITQALFDGPEPISARAAFNALTRGPWRLTPGQVEPRGVLRVGGVADLALWEVGALAVQAPDDRAAFWSTDQRAGTPLLPALGEGEDAPRLTLLHRRGIEVNTDA